MTRSTKFISFISLALSTLAPHTQALANTGGTVPDCSSPELFVPNSWILLVNEDDLSGRADLLATLRALSTGGFSVGGFIPADPAVVILAEFDPSYYGANTQAAIEARDGALGTLAQSDGVTLECNGILGPNPAITIRN